MERDPVRAALQAAADDPSARRARREACRVLAVGLDQVGKSLSVAGLMGLPWIADCSAQAEGDTRLVALGNISHTAAALISGTLALAELGNVYAASALNRQLVEVEYLAWAFAEDQEEAANWLSSSREDRQRRWQPRHLRDRSKGRFRGSDYADHCELGGHPTPDGARTLLRLDVETRSPLGADGPTAREIVLSEAVQHGTSAWRYLLTGVVVLCLQRELDPKAVVPDGPAKEVGQAEGVWLERDRLPDTWKAATISAGPD